MLNYGSMIISDFRGTGFVTYFSPLCFSNLKGENFNSVDLRPTGYPDRLAVNENTKVHCF